MRRGGAMNSARLLKTLLVGGWFLGIGWSLSTIAPPPAHAETSASSPWATASEVPQDQGYVGSEACQACHDVESSSFSHTAHSRAFPLRKVKGEGCETCHGPGKEHVDGGGDKTKIR